MKRTMEILIARKEYDEQTFIDMLNMYMMWGEITPQEYNELRLQLKEVFHPSEPLIPIEPQEPTE